LFLDEIAEIPPEVQPILLRALQERKISPVGEIREIDIDVRIISATNADMTRRIAQGLFREDVYYRLAGLNIQIPPLRERSEDIPELLLHLYRRHGGSGPLPLDKDEIDKWQTYHWPGNIRQLENQLLYRIASGCRDIFIDSGKIYGAANDDALLEKLLQGRDFNHIKKMIYDYALDKSKGHIRKAAKLLGVSPSSVCQYAKTRSI
ncbi:sigma-54-dependent Fis family transcriptional regulator, partial [bacterium]|nr:sigma-54-dependent Fis family transcriptional regulator [candidate division CSSED10-310 bacterium]